MVETGVGGHLRALQERGSKRLGELRSLETPLTGPGSPSLMGIRWTGMGQTVPQQVMVLSTQTMSSSCCLKSHTYNTGPEISPTRGSTLGIMSQFNQVVSCDHYPEQVGVGLRRRG